MKTRAVLLLICFSFLILKKSFNDHLLSFNLIGVFHLNRHGARSPGDFKEISQKIFTGISERVLTSNGARQMDLLGKWITERYVYNYTLFTKNYIKHKTIFRTSPLQRTVFSGISFIKGLYPDSTVTVHNISESENSTTLSEDDIPPIIGFHLGQNYPEIPLLVKYTRGDPTFLGRHCRRMADGMTLNELLSKDDIYEYSDEDIQEAIDDIKTQFPEGFENLTNPQEVYTMKYLRRLEGFIRPVQYHFKNKFFTFSPMTNLILEKIKFSRLYETFFDNSEISSLIVSSLLDELITILKNFASTNEIKYAFYSGHDINIIALFKVLLDPDYVKMMLNNLSLYSTFLYPDFAASLIFEIYEINHKIYLYGTRHVVKILYNGEEIKKGLKSEIQYDQQLKGIDFESFVKYLIKNINPEYKHLIC